MTVLEEVAASAKEHHDRINRHLIDAWEDAWMYAVTGQRSEREMKERRQKARSIRALRRSRQGVMASLAYCPRCGASAEVRGGIGCGIDGGPSPVTIKGVQIRCSRDCGMKTDVFEGYPDPREQLKVLISAAAQWAQYVDSCV
jgi:hypothetical protein